MNQVDSVKNQETFNIFIESLTPEQKKIFLKKILIFIGDYFFRHINFATISLISILFDGCNFTMKLENKFNVLVLSFNNSEGNNIELSFSREDFYKKSYSFFDDYIQKLINDKYLNKDNSNFYLNFIKIVLKIVITNQNTYNRIDRDLKEDILENFEFYFFQNFISLRDFFNFEANFDQNIGILFENIENFIQNCLNEIKNNKEKTLINERKKMVHQKNTPKEEGEIGNPEKIPQKEGEEDGEGAKKSKKTIFYITFFILVLIFLISLGFYILHK